jgi:hypothetical protein
MDRTAHLTDGTAALSSYWAKNERAQRSRRLWDGRIVWTRIPVTLAGRIFYMVHSKLSVRRVE